MNQEQQEIRALFHIVEQTAEIAEDSTLTQSFKEGERRCITQFNNVLERLNEMEAIPADLFDPLPDEATFSEISIACHHLAAYLNEGVDTSTDLKGMFANFLGNRLGQNFSEDMKDASIDVLIRKSMPDFFVQTKLEDIKKTFNAVDEGNITLQTDLGNIDIHTSQTNVIDVVVRRSAQLKIDKSILEILNDLEVDFDEQDENLYIEAKFKSNKRYWEKMANRFDIHFDITVPKNCVVNLKTGQGDISIQDVDGNTNANSLEGDLSFENITGTVIGHTSKGSVKVNRCKGDVYIRSTQGNIEVSDNTGVVDVMTSKGDLHCMGVTGNIDGTTEKGNIVLTNCKGGANLKSTDGTIEVENDGPVTAKTSEGSIIASFSGQPQHDSLLDTTGGGITVAFIPDIDVNIDAQTSNGKIATEFPVAAVVHGTIKVGELQGHIKNGGPLMRLRSIGGDINLKQKDM
ncbi:hypothetical protein C6497_09925 [Candidatus Poribacteria bacterium]|nr:MAG: hypothetical protein C6497_09925 [Candidatus Poribacteria bacterium]